MWGLLGFLTLAVLGIAAQEDPVELVCNFQPAQVLQTSEYGCVLNGVQFELSSQDAEIIVLGDHDVGRENADVRILQVFDSTFNNFPTHIFEIFPNIEALEIMNCGTFGFDHAFIAAHHLLQARIVYNSIPVFPQGAFPPNIEYLILYHNELTNLGEAPFVGLTNLWHLSLADNVIDELLPQHLAGLNGLTGFYINNNSLIHLHNDLFTENHVLINAHFENNFINSIGENFLDNVAESISYLGLEGNVCIDENFGIDHLTTLEVVREAIQGCVDSTAELVCNFQVTQVLQTSEYGCVLNGVQFQLSSQDAEIVVSGDHEVGRENADVRILQVFDSTFNNFPTHIFEIFPNIEALEIMNCGTFGFDHAFIAAHHLLQARIVYNSIPVFPQGAFPSNIEYLILYHNELTNLGEAPFVGLTNLWHLSLADNVIDELLPQHLAGLNGLTGFYINNNSLVHLHSDLFTDNHVLINAHFENNFISSIGENFLDNVAESISYLGLEGNVCVDENFGIDHLTTLEVVREAIQGCIDASVPAPENDRFTFELHGNLTIFDQNGNELLRINN